MICHEHKIIFVPIPKNASASVVRYVKGYLYNYGHQSSVLLMKKYEKYWDDYYKFCILRNPYDRAVSAYLLYTANPKLNDTTIQKKGPIDQYYYNFLIPYYYYLKSYITFENFYLNNVLFALLGLMLFVFFHHVE